MTINTKTVKGRRSVRYQSYDDLIRDAERIADSGLEQTLGNWSAGQIFKHLADAIESSIDGSGFVLPWPIRVVFTLLMKQKYLHDSLPAGFKAPKKFQPEAIDIREALEALRHAIRRMNLETNRAMHPAFGPISREEWDLFNLRHCEMHMSFIKG